MSRMKIMITNAVRSMRPRSYTGIGKVFAATREQQSESCREERRAGRARTPSCKRMWQARLTVKRAFGE